MIPLPPLLQKKVLKINLSKFNSAISCVQIRGGLAWKHPLPRNTRRGRQDPGGHLRSLSWREAAPAGGGLGGWVLGSAPPSSPPHPAVPSFLSAIQTVHTAKQGLKGEGGETVHLGRVEGSLQEGREAVLLIEVAPGLFTGFWESRAGAAATAAGGT